MKKIENILLYNIKTKEMLDEISNIRGIFHKMNVEVTFYETTNEEDILSYPSLFNFIKMPNDSKRVEKINEFIEVQRGWAINFIVDDNFFKDTKKLEETINEYYEEYKNLKVMYECTGNFIKDGIIGFAIGDALGVPVEFRNRKELEKNPVTAMQGYGTYNLPKGTWSDDTSMSLATMDSIIQTGKININDIAKRFINWFRNAEYTATGKVFDIGRTTMLSLANFEFGSSAQECGQGGELDNGNGSLMRMLPIAYYIWFMKYKEEIEDKTIYDIVKNVSSITHKHEISIMGCYIFVKYAIEIMDGKYKEIAYENIKNLDYSFFNNETIKKYDRILKGNIKEETIENIRSTGYIVDTLEAVLWLFLNGGNYNDTILKAVNLGEDTDTIAAIAGGLLGIHYGSETINEDWKRNLKRVDYIESLCEEFFNCLCIKKGMK